MKNYLLAISILSCMILAGCSAGYVTERPAEVTYVRPGSPGPGYVWIGGEWEYSETIITGGKDPGSSPERAGHGNQDIGKITTKVTNGIRAAGRNNGKIPKIEKPRFGRGFLNKSD